MARAGTIDGDVRIIGEVIADSYELSDKVTRTSDIAQETLQKFVIPMTSFVVHDAPQTKLPGTAANDDLGLYGTTPGTDSMYMAAGDIGGAASTRYARCTFPVPQNYDSGQTVQIRVSCAVTTTVCDTSCTIDVECWESDKEAAVGADICATAATSMNSTTWANKDFTITATNLVAGDVLDIRLAIAYSDTGNLGVMIPSIGSVELLCDTRG